MKGELEKMNEWYLDQVDFADDDKAKFWVPIRA